MGALVEKSKGHRKRSSLGSDVHRLSTIRGLHMFSRYRGIFPAVAFNQKLRFVRRLRISWHRVVSGGIRAARACIAILLIYCMVPLGVGDLYAQEAPPPQSRYFQLSYAQLDQLVAPIALYPDALVAQILGAATYPTQIAEADHFVQRNGGACLQSSLQGWWTLNHGIRA